MGYLYLAVAIVAEVVATSFLRVASVEGSRWWAYLIVGAGYLLAFVMLSFTLSNGVPLGIAYAVWAGVGVVLVALVSWIAFGELLTWQQLLGMALVVGGVVLIEAGGDHRDATDAAAEALSRST
ncbi:SMR family transporter [Herbiconiux sp.]|uniref:DMT family transporter n=1 Tax=Herbiconiux sp. TaxID=1871186 RepID=UPI0025B8BBC5|nr:SMR family transporter [Herbiconiux sp.]